MFSDIVYCIGMFRCYQILSLRYWALLVCSVAVCVVVGSFHAIRVTGCSSGQC